ncbi:MAG: hypothetical protein LBU70_05295 [Chitinispirillales bacterium]|jgi:hypothetical protein|nr:hypothetical protein [Chitinispirillales bacterium]
MSTLQVEPVACVVENDNQDWKKRDWSAHDNCAHIPNAELLKTMEDVDAGRNLVGPFATAAEAFASMMAGMEALDDEEDDLCTP